MFFAIGAVALTFLAVFGVVQLILMVTHVDRANPYVRTSIPRAFLLLLAVGEAVWYGSYWREYALFFLFALGIAVVLFGLPLLTQRSKPSYRDKLAAQLEVERQTPNPVVDAVHRAFGVGPFVLMLIVAASCALAIGAGEATALRKRTFLVLANDPSLAVVRKYGSTLIAVRFKKDGTLTGDVVLLRSGPTRALALERRRLPQLHR